MTPTDYTPPALGRPPFFGAPMLELGALMPREYWDYVESVGDGNRSEGLRRIVGQWMATRGNLEKKS
jgi:hypothetical protein